MQITVVKDRPSAYAWRVYTRNRTFNPLVDSSNLSRPTIHMSPFSGCGSRLGLFMWNPIVIALTPCLWSQPKAVSVNRPLLQTSRRSALILVCVSWSLTAIRRHRCPNSSKSLIGPNLVSGAFCARVRLTRTASVARMSKILI